MKYLITIVFYLSFFICYSQKNKCSKFIRLRYRNLNDSTLVSGLAMGVGEIDFRKNKYKAKYKKDGTKIYKIYAEPNYHNTPISTIDLYITKIQDTIILSKNNCYSCKYPIRKN